MADPLPVWPEHVRCGTCRWWERRKAAEGMCRCPTPGLSGEPDGIGEPFTLETFGCRLWEPREP